MTAFFQTDGCCFDKRKEVCFRERRTVLRYKAKVKHPLCVTTRHSGSPSRCCPIRPVPGTDGAHCHPIPRARQGEPTPGQRPVPLLCSCASRFVPAEYVSTGRWPARRSGPEAQACPRTPGSGSPVEQAILAGSIDLRQFAATPPGVETMMYSLGPAIPGWLECCQIGQVLRVAHPLHE
jgi:hypothetical protein